MSLWIEDVCMLNSRTFGIYLQGRGFLVHDNLHLAVRGYTDIAEWVQIQTKFESKSHK